MDILKDPRFWGPLFGFLGTLVGFTRWLLRVSFIYSQKRAETLRRNNVEKARLDTSVEQMKLDNSVRLITILQDAINEMKPILNQHSKLLEGFRHSFDLMQTIEGEATQMMSSLKVQYQNFLPQIQKFNGIGDSIMDRMKSIETEIKILKEGSGNVYVTTKK